MLALTTYVGMVFFRQCGNLHTLYESLKFLIAKRRSLQTVKYLMSNLITKVEKQKLIYNNKFVFSLNQKKAISVKKCSKFKYNIKRTDTYYMIGIL